MSDRWQDDAEYQRRKTIEWADTGINIDYAAELGVEAYKRWLAAGGGSITPHPEGASKDASRGRFGGDPGSKLGAGGEVTPAPLPLDADLSVTPHPEARETDTGFSVTSEEYLAQIDAAVARGDAPAYMAEMLRKALAAGGSPTTTPDGKQAFDSPGVLKDAAPTITPQPNGPPPYSPDIHNEPRVTTTPTTEPTETPNVPEDQQVEEEQ